jgi:hypothetical protein
MDSLVAMTSTTESSVTMTSTTGSLVTMTSMTSAIYVHSTRTNEEAIQEDFLPASNQSLQFIGGQSAVRYLAALRYGKLDRGTGVRHSLIS